MAITGAELNAWTAIEMRKLRAMNIAPVFMSSLMATGGCFAPRIIVWVSPGDGTVVVCLDPFAGSVCLLLIVSASAAAYFSFLWKLLNWLTWD